MGLIAGFLLFFVLFAYIFWPQKVLTGENKQPLDDHAG